MSARIVFVAVLLAPLVAAVPAWGQGIEWYKSKNFNVEIERSPKNEGPTAQEIAMLAEELCARLDQLLLKYSPYNPQQIADGERVLPRCDIYLFNTRESCNAKRRAEGCPPLDPIANGDFAIQSDTVCAIRHYSPQVTREIILHEITHYYTHNHLPGGGTCYPNWFHEALAETFSEHIWNGNRFVIAVRPRLSNYGSFDYSASGLIGLKRLRTYTRAQSGAGQAGNRTPFNSGLIQPFIDTMFTGEALRRDGMRADDPSETSFHCYAAYRVLGWFFVMARPDVLDAVFSQIAQWEKENVQTPPRQEWFNAAWEKVAEQKKVMIEEMIIWSERNQLIFENIYGNWQDMGNWVGSVAEENQTSILLFRNPLALPRFGVSPKVSRRFQVGLVFNFLDKGNYSVVSVDEGGAVLLAEIRNGFWLPGKRVGAVPPNRMGGNPPYFFSTARRGNVLQISINNTVVGGYSLHPRGHSGLYLMGTEAAFAL